MNRISVFALLLAVSLTAPKLWADSYTRGIGLYPGRTTESAAPRMVADGTYRNVALLRAATASSSADANLTAQLVTDGISTGGVPPTLRVSTHRGELSARDREKTLDGNTVSSVALVGEEAYIQYDWSGMSVAFDTLRFVARVAYQEKLATEGCCVEVLTSADGRRWTLAGQVRSAYLPGYRSGQVMSTDPNKAERRIALPLRKVMLAVPLNRRGGRYSHVRLVLRMKGAVAWDLYEVDRGPLRFWQATYANDNIKWGSTNGDWLPSAHFFSAWVADSAAAARAPQWLSIDLGRSVQVERIKVQWLYKARAGRLQTSADGRQWTDVGALADDRQLRTQARYVRLWLTQPHACGTYGVREVQVWGRGGLHAEPARPLSPRGGRTYLGGWQLRRDGSAQWIEATVPATVLSSYMNVGALPFNLTGNNMRQISESFFRSDFVYRTTFKFKPTRNHQYLHFDGIDWKAIVTLNGHRLGPIDGAFQRAHFDITPYLTPGDNLLEVRIIKNAHPGAVKLKNATNTDLNGGVLGADNPTFHATIGWDWITSTPGRNMGIWDDVYLTEDDGLSLADPMVTTRLALPDTLATLTPAVVVSNHTNGAQRVKLSGAVGPISFERELTLPAHSEQEVSFAPADFAQLRDCRLPLWWPNGQGAPYRHRAHFSVSHEGVESTRIDFRVGLRQMDYRYLDSCATLFVNGRRLDPLGGNWGFSEANLNYRRREFDAAVAYHRDMHLNMIRNWVGQIGGDAFYDACDSLGLTVWQDFWLANPWDGPDPDDEVLFMNNARDLIKRIRRHACVALYVGRNEGYPPATLDSALRHQIALLHPQLGYIPSSADDGVSGHGPYCVQPAGYYFTHVSDRLHSEQGLPNMPNPESLQRMLPADSLWPIGEAWGQHDFTQAGAQCGALFIKMLEERFGPMTDARSFAHYAQWLNYEAHRAMFEAVQTKRHGLLMWMSHPCWPNMVWQTYDYYLEPTAAYFGIKKACEPLHIQMNAASRKIEVVNVGPKAEEGLTATAHVLRPDGSLRSVLSVRCDAERDTTIELLPLDLPADSLCFVSLALSRGDSVLSQNFYVESSRPQLLRSLLQGPRPRIELKQNVRKEGGRVVLSLQVSNPSPQPALFIRLNLKGADGEQILPVMYEDNYFALMPGQSRTLTVSYAAEDGRGAEPVVEAEPL